MMDDNQDYRGPGKTSGVVASTLGYGLLGNTVGCLPAAITHFSGGDVKNWQRALTIGSTLAGVGYGVYRGYTKGAHAEQDHRTMQSDIKALKAENAALKMAWQNRLGKEDPSVSHQRA